MASASGLRRASLSESQTELGEVGSTPDGRSRKPDSSRSRPSVGQRAFNRQCLMTAAAVSLLAIIAGFSSVLLLNPIKSHVDEHSLYRTTSENTTTGLSSSDYPQLRKENEYAAYNADGARNIARQHEINLADSRNCVAVNGIDFTLGIVSQAYHSPKIFYQDYLDMACQFKIFVYPYSAKDPFANVFKVSKKLPTGNYASEHYFKMALLNSSLLTENPDEADLFYMPFSIVNMRNDKRIGVEGIQHFVKDYVSNISTHYPFWNRSGGADHFYVNCHSVGRTATTMALDVRHNVIQVVCSSNYHIQPFIPHKDATIPQVWPRIGVPEQAQFIDQRTTLAFYAGASHSPVRALVVQSWRNDTEIKVFNHKIKTPYDQALLTSKYCLHVKGYEVNTARLADAIHYGCVPIIIADYHELAFNDALDWRQLSLVVTTEDIPKLKDIIKAVSNEQYVQMQKNVMQVSQHFHWHQQPEHFDAFYMVMYELWLRRHVTRFSLD